MGPGIQAGGFAEVLAYQSLGNLGLRALGVWDIFDSNF